MSNKDKPKNSRLKSRNRRDFMTCILAEIAYTAALLFCMIMGSELCNSVIWYWENPVYRMLKYVELNAAYIIGPLLLCGWILISCRFNSKMLRQLDEVATAAGKLVSQPEEPIILSEDLADIESELNIVREKGLNNARAAKEAEQRKNDLVVYLAHDLKTPLTSVIGYLSLLRDEPEISVETREKYESIALEKAERLEELINEFFDITRFNLSNISIEVENTNLSLMLQQISNEFIPILREKNLSIKENIDEQINVLCDRDKLERVFDNLLRNAVNYCYDNSEISLSLKSQDDYAVVKIENTGKTIPPEKLNRIFEQFFRLDSSRSTKTGGAGLGLAIAKEIVELHQGTITAESNNEITSFTVKLKKNVRNN